MWNQNKSATSKRTKYYSFKRIKYYYFKNKLGQSCINVFASKHLCILRIIDQGNAELLDNVVFRGSKVRIINDE